MAAVWPTATAVIEFFPAFPRLVNSVAEGCCSVQDQTGTETEHDDLQRLLMGAFRSACPLELSPTYQPMLMPCRVGNLISKSALLLFDVVGAPMIDDFAQVRSRMHWRNTLTLTLVWKCGSRSARLRMHYANSSHLICRAENVYHTLPINTNTWTHTTSPQITINDSSSMTSFSTWPPSYETFYMLRRLTDFPLSAD